MPGRKSSKPQRLAQAKRKVWEEPGVRVRDRIEPDWRLGLPKRLFRSGIGYHKHQNKDVKELARQFIGDELVNKDAKDTRVRRHAETYRPILNMANNVRAPKEIMSKALGRWVAPNLLVKFPTLTNVWLPVWRIDQLYYQEHAKKTPFCGTFYFTEQGSRTLLNLGHVGIFGSKVAAWISLISFVYDNLSEQMRDYVLNFLNQTLIDLPEKNETVKDRWAELLSFDGYYVALQLLRTAWGEKDANEERLIKIMLPFYMPVFYNFQDALEQWIPSKQISVLYPCIRSFHSPKINWSAGAMHDIFDQPLCSLTRILKRFGLLKLDTLLFQHEAGGMRSNTEILDTRMDSAQYRRTINASIGVALGQKVSSWWSNPTASASDVKQTCSSFWFLKDGFFRPIDSQFRRWEKLEYGKHWTIDNESDSLEEKFPLHIGIQNWYPRPINTMKRPPTIGRTRWGTSGTIITYNPESFHSKGQMSFLRFSPAKASRSPSPAKAPTPSPSHQKSSPPKQKPSSKKSLQHQKPQPPTPPKTKKRKAYIIVEDEDDE